MQRTLIAAAIAAALSHSPVAAHIYARGETVSAQILPIMPTPKVVFGQPITVWNWVVCRSGDSAGRLTYAYEQDKEMLPQLFFSFQVTRQCNEVQKMRVILKEELFRQGSILYNPMRAYIAAAWNLEAQRWDRVFLLQGLFGP